MKMVVFLVMISSICLSQTKTKADTALNSNKDSILIIGCDFPEIETAEFPGGFPELYKYLKRNLKYPVQECVSGSVVVSFMVLRDGSISDVKVVKGIQCCKACDDETLRVIREMPKWKPEKRNGIPVDQRFCVPVKF
ncbi:MAG TPA: energy transducer TonB [Bacteroidia bacterium]|jgi:protein TonB